MVERPGAAPDKKCHIGHNSPVRYPVGGTIVQPILNMNPQGHYEHGVGSALPRHVVHQHVDVGSEYLNCEVLVLYC